MSVDVDGLIKETLQGARARMEKSLEALQHELSTIRTGRASPALVDRLMVDYYGSQTPLQSLAGISVPEARQILITPYDKGAMAEIEKAIQKSDLGLTPNNDGSVIRINIPQLTEERRLEFVKLVHQKGEDARVSVRNVRRDDVDALRKEQKDGKMSEDQLTGALDEIQKLTDGFSARIDEMSSKKEAELREV